MGVFGRGSEISDEPEWFEHEARAGELAAAVPPLSARSEMYPADHAAVVQTWLRSIRLGPPEVAGSVLLLLIRRAGDEGGWGHDAAARIRSLGRFRAVVSARDAAYALRTAAALPDTWSASEVLVCASALAARAKSPADRRLPEAAAELAATLRARRYVSERDRARISRDLSRLGPPPRRSPGLEVSAITAGDGWSALVLPELASWTGPVRPANALIRHLLSASGTRPPAAWLATASELLAEPDASRLLRLLLEAASAAPAGESADGSNPGAAANPSGDPVTATPPVSAQNADLLRAAAWVAGGVHEDWVVPALTATALRGIASGACVASLGGLSCRESIDALEHLLSAAADSGLRREIGAAIRSAGKRTGLGADEIAERLVRRADLDDEGQRLVTIGRQEARVTVTPDGEVVTQWRGRRAWSRRIPASAAPATIQLVRLAAREVSAALEGERRRLEGTLASGLAWTAREWRRRYLDHPVTGPVARGLIWTCEPAAGGRLAGIPDASGKLMTLDGPAELPCDGTVRLWHPLLAGPEETGRWRELLAETGQQQPFPQAFREVRAPDEGLLPAETTLRYFAGQAVRHPEAIALLAERGWTADYLDPFRNLLRGEALRWFPGAGLTAVLRYEAVGSEGDLAVDSCVLGLVEFRRLSGRGRPARLATVPEVVFSEAMLDLHLVAVATASIPDP